MNTINLEGKLYGYEKKTLAVVALLILVAGVMFYAGAKYEKKKLGSLKSSSSSTSTTGTKVKKSKTQTPDATPAADGGATSTPAADNVTPAPTGSTTAPAATTPAPKTPAKTPASNY